jgi:hypothetical protein
MFSSLLKHDVLLKTEQLEVDLSKNEVVPRDEGGDDRIIVVVEVSEDVGDEVVVRSSSSIGLPPVAISSPRLHNLLM